MRLFPFSLSGPLVLLLMLGCSEPVSVSDEAGAILQFAIAESANQTATAVRISVSYRRNDGENVLLHDIRIEIASIDQGEVSVELDLTQCLSDPTHVGSAGVCTVDVELTLLDDAETVLDQQTIGPLMVESGVTMTTQEVTLEEPPPPVDSVYVTPDSAELVVGEMVAYTAQTFDKEGEELIGRVVTWSTGDSGVVTVSESGVVMGAADGLTTVTATSEGVSDSAWVTVFPVEYAVCSAQSEIPVAECRALVALYNSTNGPGWTNNTGWLATTAPCSWYGVTCDAGSIGSIDLSQNELVGLIPSELSGLTDLLSLDLSSNQLMGPIPPGLGQLSNLEYLILWNNQLTGSIPTELGDLSNLLWLVLDVNQLTGSIPTELGDLEALRYLYLDINQLSGAIPIELGSLANLQILGLSSNELTAGIPSVLGGLSNLQSLSLSDNELSGGIPTELGNLSNLVYMNLDTNQLTGSIPSELGNLSGLQGLRLHKNQLSGLVPLEVAQNGGRIQDAYSAAQCAFAPPGNEGLFMVDSPEYRAADLDGDGLICGVGFSAVSSFSSTSAGYPESTPDFNSVCQQEVGANYRIADWNDVVSFVSTAGFNEFFLQSGMTPSGTQRWVTRNGSHFFSGNRHYFIARHDGTVPGGWLVHDQLGSNTIDLGSWYGAKLILCFDPGS